MKKAVLVGLFLSLGAVAHAEEAPDYSKRNNVYSMSQTTPVPHARFINAPALRAYQKCAAQNASQWGNERQSCQNYEFTAPYSLDTETVKVGTRLRAAWQRLEDRYYWRAMTRLNNPAMVLTHCSLDWSTGQDKTRPAEVVLNVDDSMYPKQLAGKVPQQAPGDRLRLDTYGLIPQVPNKDYCAGLDMDLTIMYLPGTCFYLFGAKLFCIEGTEASLNPLAPKPIGFRHDLAVQRVNKAVKEAHSDYLKEYGEDVLKALAPSPKFFPLMWSGLTDAVVAPTMSLKPDLTFVKNKAQEAGSRLGGVFRGTAYPYYLQGLTGPALPLRAHLLPKAGDVLGLPNPPGVWKLEEFKRRFPVNNPVAYERFGYTNLFQSWNEVRPRLLPEEPSAKPLRQMIYMASGANVYLPSPTPVPMPAPMLLREFAAGLPYTGTQTHFTWVSVGEGYEVPRVQGVPAASYGEVTK